MVHSKGVSSALRRCTLLLHWGSQIPVATSPESLTGVVDGVPSPTSNGPRYSSDARLRCVGVSHIRDESCFLTCRVVFNLCIYSLFVFRCPHIVHFQIDLLLATSQSGNQVQARVRPTNIADMKAYLMSSFHERAHPLNRLVDDLVKAFTFSYSSLAANRFFLTDAVNEVGYLMYSTHAVHNFTLLCR